MNNALHTHDCRHCVYLGTHEMYDMYIHQNTFDKEHYIGVVRFGDTFEHVIARDIDKLPGIEDSVWADLYERFIVWRQESEDPIDVSAIYEGSDKEFI